MHRSESLTTCPSAGQHKSPTARTSLPPTLDVDPTSSLTVSRRRGWGCECAVPAWGQQPEGHMRAPLACSAAPGMNQERRLLRLRGPETQTKKNNKPGNRARLRCVRAARVASKQGRMRINLDSREQARAPPHPPGRRERMATEARGAAGTSSPSPPAPRSGAGRAGPGRGTPYLACGRAPRLAANESVAGSSAEE